MTSFLAGMALGLSAAMWLRWDQVLHLRDELDRLHRVVRSTLARCERLERLALRRNGHEPLALEAGPDAA